MKIVLIVMNVICAVLYGWLGFKHSDKTCRVIYMVCAVMWVLGAVFNTLSLIGV